MCIRDRSYLFKDFKNLEIFPIRGRISTPLNILFQPRWKRHIEKTGINILLDKDNKIHKFQLKDKRKVNNQLLNSLNLLENVVID